MNIVKRVTPFVMLLLFVFSMNAYAEERGDRVNEVDVRDVKLSDDRTGIVKNIACFGCDFKFVRITKNTKATQKGKAVDILEVKKLSNKVVMVAFDPKTREVSYLRW